MDIPYTEDYMKTAIIAPCHIQPTEAWVNALEKERVASDATIIIVDDSDGKVNLPKEWMIYDYLEQESFLGDMYTDFARMFHKCSACKAFGMLVAYEQGFEAVIVLDSDCIVSDGFVESHLAALKETCAGGWGNPLHGTDQKLYPRGFPYSMRNWPIVCNMGMWRNVLDLNGKDRKVDEPKDVVMEGQYAITSPFPISGMNVSMLREAMLGFFFIPNADDFKRIDDIWGGYIFYKLMYRMHKGISLGEPIVWHDTIVDAKADEEEEIAMYECEDDFITLVDEVFHDIDYPKGDGFNQALFINLAAACRDSEDFQGFAEPLLWWSKAIERHGK